MNFFRKYISPFLIYISPFLILAMFIVALVAVSSRAFLDSDMAAPAPVEIEKVGMMKSLP